MLHDGVETILTHSDGRRLDLDFDGHVRVSYTVKHKDMVVLSWKGAAEKDYTIRVSGLSM